MAVNCSVCVVLLLLFFEVVRPYLVGGMCCYAAPVLAISFFSSNFLLMFAWC